MSDGEGGIDGVGVSERLRGSMRIREKERECGRREGGRGSEKERGEGEGSQCERE